MGFCYFSVIYVLKLENDIATPLKPKFNMRYGDNMFETTKVNKTPFFFRKIEQLLSKNYTHHRMKLKIFLDTKLTSVNGI